MSVHFFVHNNLFHIRVMVKFDFMQFKDFKIVEFQTYIGVFFNVMCRDVTFSYSFV